MTSPGENSAPRPGSGSEGATAAPRSISGSDSGNSADSLAGTSEEQRLGELINEFFDRRARGENLSEQAFLAEHPEEAEELQAHFGGLDLLVGLRSSDAILKSPVSSTVAGGPIPTPHGSSAGNHLTDSPASFPTIPGYDILKQIGRGGMGIVFKALQKSTRRAVALKVLLEGPLASEMARRRFEREIALAAQLRHSNIIPIYDSGVAEGRMYYAMEYVHGSGLGAYLRANNLNIAARLRLFAKICQAVSHAHQRGVVHRDLKPSNILVDADNEPHIVDFGLAKASAFMDATTSVTAQIIGTPAYMSPEQAAGDPSALDTRTDVYSLGVLLYEMLTEQMPYDTAAPLGKILENVAHADPMPPGEHNAEVDTELSTIVLKALQKAKDDRYQSVDTFSSDVQRYLAGEPITAKPASTFYLLRKAINNNRAAVAFTAVLVTFAAATWGVAYHYSSKIRHTEEEVRQLKDEASGRSAKPSAVSPVEGRSQPGQPTDETTAGVRRDLEWVLQNADPEVVKALEPLAAELSKSVSRGEDARTALLRLLASSMTELRTAPSKPLPKAPELDDGSAPQMSPRPSKPQTAGGEGIPSDVLKAVETLARFLQSGTPPSATSQPAMSQPAPADQPTTSPTTPS